MDRVTHEKVAPLLEIQEEPVISIYIPTHRFQTPVTVREDQTRFKNLINKAREKMAQAGLSEDKAGQYGNALEKILDDQEMWRQSLEGMAVFMGPSGVYHFHFPVECDERVTVGNSYDVVPLLTIAECETEYYLLALAVHQPKIFKGSSYGLEPVDIELPSSPEEALNIDEMFSNSNTVRSGSGSAGISTHGQGDVREAGSEELLKFFRIIDNELNTSKAINSSLPILLTGTSNHIAEYRQISKSQNLLEAKVESNYNKAPLQEVHDAVWPVVEKEVCDKKITAALERFNNLIGAQKASSDLAQINEALTAGRVDTLLVGIRSVSNDTVDDNRHTGGTKKIIFTEPYDTNHINELAMKTVNQGGSIIGLDIDQLPNESSVAAIYRY